MSPARAIARRAFADARVRTFSFALLFAVAALLQATAYRTGYPTLEDRLKFARSVAAAEKLPEHTPYWIKQGLAKQAAWSDLIHPIEKYWLPVVRGDLGPGGRPAADRGAGVPGRRGRGHRQADRGPGR